MSQGRRKSILGLLVLAVLVILGAFNLRKPRILVLHSRSADTAWVRGVDRGLQRVLTTNQYPVSVEWHHLGLDSARDGEDLLKALSGARRAIHTMDPHLIVAIDDEANRFVARDYGKDGRTRILYASVDCDPESYAYPTARWVTGIEERLPLSAIKECLGVIRPGRALRIHVVGGTSQTDRCELQQFQEFDWAPHEVVEIERVRDFEGLQEVVRRAEDGILIVLDCPRLQRRSGGWASSREVVEEIQGNSRAIAVGLTVDFVELGGDIAFVPPSEANGTLAMGMALDWLKDLSPSAPPPPKRVMSHFDLALRPARLRIRKVEVPQIYIEAARNSGMLYP